MLKFLIFFAVIDYPQNLSILLRGGRDDNYYSCSNGE